MRFSFLIFALTTIVGAPTLAAGQPTTSNWTTEVVQSVVLGTTRPVYVATPEGYSTRSERYPVLVLLDADDRAQFNLALATVTFLTDRGAIPPLLVVGIPNGTDRAHDLTPAAIGSSAAFAPTAGGARAFAEFLSGEVVPMVRAKYRALNTTVLAGHSYGGLFAMHVATTNTGQFAAILAMSPSLWWNDSTVAISYADAIAKSATKQRLFASSGGLEPAINGPTRRFVARFDSIKPSAFPFEYREYADDGHRLTPGPSLSDGLRFAFAPVALDQLTLVAAGPKPDSARVQHVVAETERRYAEGARALGMPERLPENILNQFGYTLLRSGLPPAAAIGVFARNAALHADSPNVYDSLADGYLAGGDTARAVACLNVGIETSRRTGIAAPPQTEQRLSRLRRASTVGVDRRQLDRVRDEYAKAYDAGNAAQMSSFYVDTAVRMPYDAPAQFGIDAIARGYADYFTHRRFHAQLSLVADDVVINGDQAVERGTYHEVQRYDGGAARREDGKYIVVATRAGITWKYFWSMFSRDSAAALIKSSGANVNHPTPW